jgi:hypothetical protein
MATSTRAMSFAPAHRRCRRRETHSCRDQARDRSATRGGERCRDRKSRTGLPGFGSVGFGSVTFSMPLGLIIQAGWLAPISPSHVGTGPEEVIECRKKRGRSLLR